MYVAELVRKAGPVVRFSFRPIETKGTRSYWPVPFFGKAR
jgi:hypothetical protein